jgi:hypothetical protein
MRLHDRLKCCCSFLSIELDAACGQHIPSVHAGSSQLVSLANARAGWRSFLLRAGSDEAVRAVSRN